MKIVLYFVLFAALQLTASPIFYVSFDKDVNADISGGNPAAVGANNAVIGIFASITQKNQGFRGEALNLTGGSAAANIAYEAESNINTQEGTIQFWFKPDFDIWPMTEKTEIRNFVSIDTHGSRWNGIRIGVEHWFYKGKAQFPVLFFSIFDGKDHRCQASLAINGKIRPFWKTNQWMHVTAAWNAQSMRLYLDGQLVSERDFPAKANQIKPMKIKRLLEIGTPKNKGYL